MNACHSGQAPDAPGTVVPEAPHRASGKPPFSEVDTAGAAENMYDAGGKSQLDTSGNRAAPLLGGWETFWEGEA
ncbi:hypothetical protein GCM10017600_26920 [Streptosporangium carneum]|uniref:Uncharacterized protein n=1 Tax=Streptosporangium carneum TaxID=47481 RepID=A0A9W6HZQ2_9ACTN|nr:hypothetical protein GCM10017600_26920 [Streptosporangium carneum]